MTTFFCHCSASSLAAYSIDGCSMLGKLDLRKGYLPRIFKGMVGSCHLGLKNAGMSSSAPDWLCSLGDPLPSVFLYWDGIPGVSHADCTASDNKKIFQISHQYWKVHARQDFCEYSFPAAPAAQTPLGSPPSENFTRFPWTSTWDFSPPSPHQFSNQR